MKRNEIISKLYLDKRFSDAAKKITNNTDYCEDLKSEVILVLLEKTDENLLIELDKKCQLIFYSVRIMLNMFKSNRSSFKKKYEHNSIISDAPYCLEIEENEFFKVDEIEHKEKIDKINNKLESIYWYDRQIFLEYLEVKSYRKLEAKTRIPMKSLQLTCIKVKEILKNDL